VINEDTAFLQLMHDLLEEEGYEVASHREVKGVYEKIVDDRPDLIVLDIVIGGETKGWELLELLTLDPRTRRVPVIVCTAAVDALRGREDQLTRLGIRGLTKPFDLEELLAAVQQALASRA
jgi:CheY-like chemotaxis protein